MGKIFEIDRENPVKNQGIMPCILSRCPYDNNLEMIQSFI
jgi:hypothetical protein